MHYLRSGGNSAPETVSPPLEIRLRDLTLCGIDFCLAVSNDGFMGLSSIARALGRRGGVARARKLSPERRREIASQGGRSKALSRHASRRIRENFEYLKRVSALRKAAPPHGS